MFDRIDDSPVIIAGMHRSGTSMITRELEKLGLFLGNDLEQNHESKFFIGLNEKLLKESGGSWDNPSPINNILNDNELNIAYERYLKDSVRSLRFASYLGCAGVYKNPSLWGWKDPRNSITLPIWRNIFPRCRVIVIERHGIDVAASLVTRREKYLKINLKKYDAYRNLYKLMSKRGTFTDSARCSNIMESLRLWHQYALEARKFTELHQNSLIIRFEDFTEDPKTLMHRLCDFLGLSFPNQLQYSHIDSKRSFAYKRTSVVGEMSDSEKSEANKLLHDFQYSLS